MLGLTRKSKLVKAQNEIEELNKTIEALTEEIVGKIEIAEKAAKDKQEELNKQIEVSLKLQDQIKKVEAEKAPAVKKTTTRKRSTTTTAKKKTTAASTTAKKKATTTTKRKTATKKKAEEADK